MTHPLALLLCGLSYGEPPPAPPAPAIAFIYSSLTVVRINPLGLQEQLEFGLQARLWNSDSILLKDAFAGVYFTPLLTPAFMGPGVTVKVQPLAVLKLEARYSWVKYLATFNLIQSFPSPSADYSDTAIDARADRAYDADGTNLTLGVELKGKLGPVVARSKLMATFHDMDLREGDRVWYDQYLDLLIPGTGWTLANDLDVLWQIPMDEDGAMLMLGARYTVATPLYAATDFLPGESQEHENGPFHRLGPMFVYTFFDRPGAAFNKPSLIAIVSWHLAHRYRTGADTSQALPYAVLAFAFTGELWRAQD